MKINFVIWRIDRSGGVRVLLEIANRLTERGHDVTITTRGIPGSYTWFPLKTSRIIYAQEKPISLTSILNDVLGFMPDKISKNLKISMPYATLLRAQAIKLLSDSIPREIDINIATYCFTAFSVHRSDIGTNFYYLQHYEPVFFDDAHTKRWVDKTYRLPLNRIANSSWLRTLLIDRFGVDSYGPIVPGVEREVFYPRKVKKNCPEKLVVALGISKRWKGLLELFEALKIVQKDVPNIKLILYGSEPYLKNSSPVPCDYLYKISDTKLADLYSMADVVVTPSWYESSPLPPLEAMACGTPVVTTRYGTEDYCFHEKNCIVVTPKNSKALAEGILRLLKNENLREQFSREGQKTTKQFTWEKATNQIENVLKTLSRNS